MKVIIKKENSNINNSDIKWYLADALLWISKEKNYQEIEEIISESFGSFNWLYDINDTLLFERDNGKFILSVISLSGKIDVVQDVPACDTIEIKGDLFLSDKKNFKFESSDIIQYVRNKDCLLSCLKRFLMDKNIWAVEITEDFDFYIIDDSLVGWLLKNASKHLCTSDSDQIDEVMDCNVNKVLADYLKLLKLWEEDEEKIDELKRILEIVNEEVSLPMRAIKESIMALLE